MKPNKERLILWMMCMATFILCFTINNQVLRLILITVSLLGTLLFLYRTLPKLTNVSGDNPKLGLLKHLTLFSVVVIAIAMGIAYLVNRGMVTAYGEKYLAAALVLLIIIVTGNVAPKLPFNRHTGLRLPWTVSDEETWIVAHRIIGYLSLPLALLYLAAIPAVGRFEFLTLSVILLWVGVPAVYSLWFYLRKAKGKL